MSPKHNSLREQFEFVRSKTLTDRRYFLKTTCYIYLAILIACMFAPVAAVPTALANVGESVDIFRHKSDLSYLSRNATLQFYIEYKTIYSIQMLTTLAFVFLYGVLCISSGEKRYFVRYKDTYLSVNSGFALGLICSFMFLFLTSEFGITTEYSWFEDNKSKHISFFPVPMDWSSLVITANLFAFSFFMSVGLVENLIVSLFGQRVSE